MKMTSNKEDLKNKDDFKNEDELKDVMPPRIYTDIDTWLKVLIPIPIQVRICIPIRIHV